MLSIYLHDLIKIDAEDSKPLWPDVFRQLIAAIENEVYPKGDKKAEERREAEAVIAGKDPDAEEVASPDQPERLPGEFDRTPVCALVDWCMKDGEEPWLAKAFRLVVNNTAIRIQRDNSYSIPYWGFIAETMPKAFRSSYKERGSIAASFAKLAKDIQERYASLPE